MGLEQRVPLTVEPPAWERVRARLAERGQEPAMRMIDGQPALPDEEPPAGWRELRVAVAGGMVTIRREPDAVALLVWGNADDNLLAARDALAEAYTDLST